MCSELLRIPLDWLNAPLIGSVSVSMFIALTLGIGMVKLLLWGRKTGRMADAWGYVPGMLMIAAAVLFVPRFVQSIPIRGYGVMVLLGSVTGVGMAVYRAKQRNLSPEVIYSLAFGMFIFGILGARLFFVIEYWETRFQFDSWRETLLEVVKFTEGGLVVYGSLIGATFAFLAFTARHRLPPFAMADLIAPSLLAGLAFGRIGCLMNGCCYGGESTQPWAVTFPQESAPYVDQVVKGRMYGFAIAQVPGKNPHLEIVVVDEGVASESGLQVGMEVTSINSVLVQNIEQAHRQIFEAYSAGLSLRMKSATGQSFNLLAATPQLRSYPVHPTQIYSAVHAALLSWLLWSFYPLRSRDGEVTALMLTIYPISRFLLEIIRIDESAVFGTGLSISQNISIVLFAAAIGLWIYLRRQAPYRASFVPAA